MKPPKNFYSNLDRRKQGLPEVPEASAADAGKIIKVGDTGNYELAQDAGAKELVITLSSNFTADKTYNEILAALNRGDFVKLVTWSDQNYIFSGKFAGRICFACINGNYRNPITNVDTIAVDDTNSWEMYLDTIEHLPATTSADAGKVLTVGNNGAWGLDIVPKSVKYYHVTFDKSASEYLPVSYETFGTMASDIINDISIGICPIIYDDTNKEIFYCVKNDISSFDITFMSFKVAYSGTKFTAKAFKIATIAGARTGQITSGF